MTPTPHNTSFCPQCAQRGARQIKGSVTLGHGMSHPQSTNSFLGTSRQRRLANLAADTVRDPRFRLLVLACLLMSSAVLWLCTGCASGLAGGRGSRAPTVLVAPESEAARAKESALAAHVAQATLDNSQSPESLPKQAVAAHLTLASHALPSPTPEDFTKAAALSEAVYSGDAARAQAASVEARARIAKLTAEHAREREARSLELQRTISDFNAELKAAQAEANRQAQLRLTQLFGLLGAVVSGIGLVSAVTGWSRVGLSLVPAGVALGGSGLLWGRPWFLYLVGGSLALCCVAVGILWAVQVSRSRKEAL